MSRTSSQIWRFSHVDVLLGVLDVAFNLWRDVEVQFLGHGQGSRFSTDRLRLLSNGQDQIYHLEQKI